MKTNGEAGPLELSIEERSGAIVLWFGDDYALLPPEQAMEIGETLMRYGYSAKTGQDIDSKRILSEQIRNKLHQRVSLVIKNLQDKKKAPLFVAQEVVDVVLREVL